MDPSLCSLFISAFISSTLFPGGSEAVLAYVASESPHAPWLLVLLASLGNTLGGMSSWLVGRIIVWRFPMHVLQQRHQQALARLRRWGSPVLVLSWLPVIGDPLCLAAGWLRLPWLASLLFIAIGKTARYAVIVWVIV